MAAKTIDIRGILTKNLSVTALFMALILGGIIMAVCGYNPFEAYGAILEGAFAGKKAICQTLVQATPLIFAGLAYTVAKRANLINLGIEGQLYIGALGTWFAMFLDWIVRIVFFAVRLHSNKWQHRELQQKMAAVD